MADTALSQMPLRTSPAANSRLYIVTYAGGVWESGGIELRFLFGAISANVATTGTLTANGAATFRSTLAVTGNTAINSVTTANRINSNTVYLTNRSTPANSTATVSQGRFWFDATYAYFATANNVIKRVALSSF